MGLLQPQRTGPGGRQRVYSTRDRTRLRLTLRAKRLGLSLNEAKDIIAKLKSGGNFEELAKVSKDPGSKDRGGELELGLQCYEVEAAFETKECEVVAIPAERQDAAAARAEVLVERRPGAATTALERNGTDGNRFGRQPSGSE